MGSVEEYELARVIDPPLRMKGEVIHGFKRGSKELGIPTANLDADLLKTELDGIQTGIYYGWASVGNDPKKYKTVMSIGWNPFFKNEKKTVEPHLLHEFPEDFYGQELRLVVTGYLRPEKNYSTLDTLVAAIKLDITTSSEKLDTVPESVAAKDDAFLAPTL